MFLIVLSSGNRHRNEYIRIISTRLCSIELTKQWVRVMQYEDDHIKNMEWVDSYKSCITSKNKYSYLAVTWDVKYNWRKNEWDQCSMKVSASKIWNEKNCVEIVFSRKNECTYLTVPDNFDCIIEKITPMTSNAQTVTTIIYRITMQCSINV